MQLSFFDYVIQYQDGKKCINFLCEIKEIIPFDNLVTTLIKVAIYKPTVGSKGDREQRTTAKSKTYPIDSMLNFKQRDKV